MNGSTAEREDWPKFDVVIGNPPYQDEAAREDGRNEPLYHLFVDAAHEISKQAVIITPARFLFNAGQTPKAWNRRMLADRNLAVPLYVEDSSDLFPGTKIRAGIAVTHRDESRILGPIGTFTPNVTMKTALHKVDGAGGVSLMQITTSGVPFAYTAKMHKDYPDAAALIGSPNDKFSIRTAAFSELPFVFHTVEPDDGHEYARILGLSGRQRVIRFIRREYITGAQSFDKWKVAVPKANEIKPFGHMAPTEVIGPGVGVTQTFITIGAFDTENEADSCRKYLLTKFARAMLYILKVTQDNPRGTWLHVPLQDFTATSDIDWSQSIPEIDQQLYAKYGLDADEIALIESRVKKMG